MPTRPHPSIATTVPAMQKAYRFNYLNCSWASFRSLSIELASSFVKVSLQSLMYFNVAMFVKRFPLYIIAVKLNTRIVPITAT